MQCYVYVVLRNNIFPNSHENYQEMEYETEIVDLEKATTQMGDCSTGTVIPKSLPWDTLRYTFQTRSWTTRKILSGWDRNSVGNCGHRFCSRFFQSILLGFMLRLVHGFLWDTRDLGISLHRWKLLERTVELIFGIAWPGYLQNLCRELLRCCSKLSTCMLTS